MKEMKNISGRPAGPILVGQRAEIRNGTVRRYTSIVRKIVSNSRTGIVFETENSLYILRFTGV